METATVNGVNLSFECKGKGDALIFCHGALSDYRAWANQSEAFAGDHTVVSYSRRSHYPQPYDPADDLGLEANAEDLAALIRHLGFDKADLVGHSYGAYTALLCASKHPQLVRKLVLIEPPVVHLIGKDPENPASILALARRSPRAAASFMRFGLAVLKPMQRLVAKGDIDAAVSLFLKATLFQPQESLAPAIRESLQANKAQLLPQVEASGIFPFDREQAAANVAPTLLVAGAHSATYMRHLADQLTAALPNARQVTIAGAGHYAHWETPSDFNRLTQDFLRA